MAGVRARADQSTQGQPAKYAYCTAENLPATPWEPYPASVGVYAASAVTVAGHENPHNVENHVSGHAPSLLTTIASVFTTIGSNNAWVHDGEVFIVLCPEHAQSIAGDGWTRRDVQDFLFNETQLPLSRLHYRDFPDYTDDQRRARLSMWPRWMRDLEPDDRRAARDRPLEVSYRGRRRRRQAFVGHPELGADRQRYPAARRLKRCIGEDRPS